MTTRAYGNTLKSRRVLDRQVDFDCKRPVLKTSQSENWLLESFGDMEAHGTILHKMKTDDPEVKF